MPQARNRGTIYRHINSSHFVFAELSLAEQLDELEEFDIADIKVSVVSQGFKHDLQCAKKHKTVADQSAEPDVQHDGRNDTECH